MSDTPTTREYRVLEFTNKDDPVMALRLIDHGWVGASSAEQAITATAEHRPPESGGTMVAVPRTNWTEREVGIEMVPKVTLMTPGGQVTLADPAPEPIMGGMDTQGAD